MKKIKTLKRILGLLLTFVLAISICFTIPSSSDVQVEAKTAQTTKEKGKGHDYTGNLASVDEKLGEFEKRNRRNDAAAAFAPALAGIYENARDTSRIDYAEMGMMAAKAIVNIAVTLSCGGGGGITDAIFDIAMNWGDDPQSEIELLQDHIDEQFEQMNDRLDDLQNEMSKLSDQIDDSTKEILNALSDAIEANYAREQVIKFMSSSDGNFNYTQFKNYLYGKTSGSKNPYYYSQAYYNKLVESIISNEPDIVITEKYNELYKSLASTSQHGDSNINMFYDYLLYNEQSGKESIQHYYFDYLSANSDLLGDRNAIVEAMGFTLDLYNTVLFADYNITMCNEYFINQIYEKYGLNPSKSAKYVYGNGAQDYVTYGDIIESNGAIEARHVQLEQQMLSDVAYFLDIAGSVVIEEKKENLDDSVIIKEDGNNLRVMIINEDDGFGYVEEKQTIYLNKLTDEFCKLFGFDNEQFTYKWVSDENVIDEGDGKLVVGDGYDSFEGQVYYKDVLLYSLPFEINDGYSFNGGDGSKENPYVINNEVQFASIQHIDDGLEKHYILYDDITFSDQVYLPFGDDKNQFTGSFDGNGHSLINIHVKSGEFLGVFGYAGLGAEIKNLTIKSGEFTIDVQDVEKIYAGAIVGKNDGGTIYNCSVINTTIIGDQKSNLLNKRINGDLGGIAGESTGSISYCSVENTQMSLIINRFYGAEKDQSNPTSGYVGGIAGVVLENGSISNCYIDSESTIYLHVTSRIHDSSHTGYPEVKAYIGGITASIENRKNIRTVYSELDLKSGDCEFGIENEGFIGFVSKKYCEKEFNNYVNGMTDDEKEQIVAQSKEKLNLPNKQYNLTYSFNCEYNEQYDCYEDQLYECGDKAFKTGNLVLYINGEEFDYTLVSYFGFDTFNASRDEAIPNDVSILVVGYYNDEVVVLKTVIPLTIKANSPQELVVAVKPNKVKYEYGEEISTLGGSFILTYQDGSTENVTSNVQIDADTTIYGKSLVTLTYGNFTTTYKIEVICHHNYNNVVVKPTCTDKGYVRHTCSICNDTYRDSFTDKIPHQEELINQTAASCTKKGYTGDKVCSICNTIIEKGTSINREMHDYKLNENDNLSHKCSVCGKNEVHEFISVENVDKILYSCVVCDHTCEENGLIPDSMPKVAISEAYALPGKGNEIVVYVEILNNPGITGASFSVNYDSRLEFVKWERGNILTDSIVSVNPHADRSACIITMGRAAVENSSGNLIKLFFKTPDDAKVMDEFELTISYSRSGAKFSDALNKSIDILTVPGKITTVEHLPGDVNNDESVDILDAVLIARHLAEYDDEIFNRLYADINIDGEVSITDLTRMLQYLVGGYGAKVINNEFKIVLNTNDGTVDFDTLLVKFYNEDGNIGNFGDIESLEPIKRPGYRFDGWYTKLVGGVKIDNTTKVAYNNSQDQQTLYAHYTLNSVTFDGNGATEGTMNERTYGDTGDVLILTNEYKNERTIVFDYKVSTIQEATIRKVEYTFLGWSLSKDGEVMYTLGEQIDMKNQEIGDVTLYAVWSKEYINLLYFDFDNAGYDLKKWSFDANGIKIAGQVGEEYQPTEKEITLYAYWEAIKYKIIYNGNGADSGSTVDIDEMRSITKGVNLVPSNFYKKGYHFVSWNTSPDGTGTSFNDRDEVRYIKTEENGIVNLYAQWKPNTYNIVFNLNIPNYANNSSGNMDEIENCTYDVAVPLTKSNFEVPGWIFKGWSISIDGNVMFKDEDTISNISEEDGATVNLYAVWEVNLYEVSKNVNNNVVVSNTNGENKYRVYNEIRNTPSFNEGGKVIVDWSALKGNQEYTNPNGTKQLNISAGGEIYFFGNSNSIYSGLNIVFSNKTSGLHTINFRDFNINGSIYNSGSAFNDLILNCVGSCRIFAENRKNAINGFSKLYITGSGDINIRGGRGADGVSGGNFRITPTIDDNNPKFWDENPYAESGTNGENGKHAIECSYIYINYDGDVEIIGGDGGHGGHGGNVTGEGGRAGGQPTLTSGGHGGKGGDGVNPFGGNQLEQINCRTLLLLYGDGGNGGNGGKGGDAYYNTNDSLGVPDHGGHGGNGRPGGAGNKGGNGGNGGNGGFSFGKKNDIGISGNGGNAGNGGEYRCGVKYTGSKFMIPDGKKGLAGTIGKAGSVVKPGKSGVDGKTGSQGTTSQVFYNTIVTRISTLISDPDDGCDSEYGSC